jgi:hypothetical protein
MCLRRTCKDARVSAGNVVELAASAGDLDPAAMMAELAQGLAAAYRADPGNAALARELRATLQVLPGGRPPGVEDELAILGRYLSTPAP